MARLPNILTLSRVAALPLFVVLFYWGSDVAHWLAALLFALIAITDWLDGWLARRWDAASEFGRMFDPIADKLLVGTVLVLLVAAGDAPVIPVIAIVCRELLVSGLRERLSVKGVSLPVTRLAKWKTTVQMVALAVLLIGPAGPAELFAIGEILLWIAALLTLVTGLDYLRAALRRVGPA